MTGQGQCVGKAVGEGDRAEKLFAEILQVGNSGSKMRSSPRGRVRKWDGNDRWARTSR